MFSQFLNSFDTLIEKAKLSEHIKRDEFIPIHNIIKKYSIDNKLILSNPEILIEQKNDHRKYVIYGESIFKHANNLANALSKVNIYVLMYTNEKNQDFVISINGNALVQLYSIRSKLINMIQPVVINNILVYPPEFELIDIYHKLYSPSHAESWEKLKKLELPVKKMLYSRKKIIGGKPNKKRFIFDNKLFLRWLKGRQDCVLIGVIAIDILTKNTIHNQKLQIITYSPIDTIVSELENIVFQFAGTKTFHKTHNANISIEPRISKTVISVKINGKNIHLVEIFNNAQFELIPYTVFGGYKIGYPEVLNMFLLLDIYLLRILNSMGFLPSHILEKNICIALLNMKKIDAIDINIYATEEYLGKYIDYTIYIKKKSLNNDFYPYNPEKCRFLKGNYRTF